MQQYDDSRSQGIGTTTTEPEQEAQQTESAALAAPTAEAAATGSAAPQTMPPPQSASGAASEPRSAATDGDETADEEMTMASLLDSPSNAMHALQRGEVIDGIVARIDADEVLVDIGQKSEGVISSRELGPAGESGALRVGQHVLVYVMQPESAEGHAILSLKRARMEQSWREAEQLMQEDRVVEAPVIDFNKGGLIVDVGVRGFVPISQIPELRGLAKGPDSGDSPQVAERLAAMRGRVLKLKIIELNRARNRLILSERLAMQEERAGRKEALLHELEPGQIRPGRVTSLASFGAFVDLGGADGLVHISQLSYSRVNHPSEVLNVGDEVQVYVLSIDPQTKKIALSLKKAQPDPWTLVEERYKVGDVVEGTITKLAKFGAFARIDDGIEGLIHLSELADHPVEKPQDVVSEGQEVKLRVIAINSQRRRLGLSLRQAQGELRPVEVPADLDEIEGGEEAGDGAEARASSAPVAATSAGATAAAPPEGADGVAAQASTAPAEQATPVEMPAPVAPEHATSVEAQAPAAPEHTTSVEAQAPAAPEHSADAEAQAPASTRRTRAAEAKAAIPPATGVADTDLQSSAASASDADAQASAPSAGGMEAQASALPAEAASPGGEAAQPSADVSAPSKAAGTKARSSKGAAAQEPAMGETSAQATGGVPDASGAAPESPAPLGGAAPVAPAGPTGVSSNAEPAAPPTGVPEAMAGQQAENKT